MTTPFADYILIPLSQGQFAKVSWSRIDEVVCYRWFANRDNPQSSFYAMRGEKLPNGKWTVIKMHRQLLGLAYGDKRTGDHINRDGLDNRDENLRIATHRQQVHNRRKQRSNTSGYIGVSPYEDSWRVGINHHGIRMHLGCFPKDQLVEAAKCYDQMAHKLFGEFAHLNFPLKIEKPTT